jgi:hypothetical protein
LTAKDFAFTERFSRIASEIPFFLLIKKILDMHRSLLKSSWQPLGDFQTSAMKIWAT